MAPSRLRVLAFTTLYPSGERPRHGIFIETRLAQLARVTGAEVRVVAPVPTWRHAGGTRLERSRAAQRETRHGLLVSHPRYAHLPGAGMLTAPFALAACAARAMSLARREGFDFDVIDAHYLYPDGVAAALVARRFDRPLVLTARGSDVNLLPRYALPRALIRMALARADGVAAVSAALASRLRDLGVNEDRLAVLRNGVDTSLFNVGDRAAARRELGLGAGPVLACVGNLVAEKGFDLVIDAIARLPHATLLIVGRGSERERLSAQAHVLGVAARVRFEDERAQPQLAVVYAAADALVLASVREGWPNVLLEAMACGTPVVATKVGGVPEIVSDAAAGIVVEDRSAASIAGAVQRLLAAPPPRAATRRHAERFGWEETARGQARLFQRVVTRHATAAGAAVAAE